MVLDKLQGASLNHRSGMYDVETTRIKDFEVVFCHAKMLLLSLRMHHKPYHQNCVYQSVNSISW